MTTDNIAYGTYTAMTVTNLQSLANDAVDPFAGWQSALVLPPKLLLRPVLTLTSLPTC